MPRPTINLAFTVRGYAHAMLRHRTIGEVEADLIALRAAAERAGRALGCLFSCADEFEAAVIRERRAQGALPPRRRRRRRRRHWLVPVVGAVMLALVFIMV